MKKKQYSKEVKVLLAYLAYLVYQLTNILTDEEIGCAMVFSLDDLSKKGIKEVGDEEIAFLEHLVSVACDTKESEKESNRDDS